MNSITHRFTLDMHRAQSQISIPITRGDTARVILVNLSDGGLPYIIETGCLAKFEVKRPTGTHLEAFCPIEKNTTIRYDFSQNVNTAAVEGIHECSVILYDAEGLRIASPRFTMIVSDRVLNSDDLDLSDDDARIIDVMIADEIKRREEEIDRKNAETARAEAEARRSLAETQRTEAEAQRAETEAQRAAAEAQRAQAETIRATAEQDRNLSEYGRVSAEEQRADAELLRVRAEDERVIIGQAWILEEEKRRQGEDVRIDAERVRAETELNRSAAEAQRAAEEIARAKAEADRVTAERERQARFDANIDNMLPDTTEEDDGKVMTVSGGAWVAKKIDGIEGVTLDISMDEENVVTVSLKNKDGTVFASGSVDLPLESAIVGGREEDGKLVFELQSGDTIEVPIGNIINGLVSQEVFNAHAVSKENPHGVTAAQVGAAPTSHNHSKSQITDFPSTMTPSAHTHSKSEISDFAHGNHVPTTQATDAATFLRNDNTWQKVTPANIGAAAATEIAKTVSTGLSNSGTAYVKISGFGNWGTGNWYEKGFAMLITSRGGELIWVAVSSDDSNTNAKAIRLLNTYSKITAIHYSTSESAVYVTVNAWCNNVNAHILSNVNGDYIPTVAQANALPSDAVKITIAEFGVTGSATNIGDSSRAIAMIGSGARPTYNSAEMAMKSDIPAIPTETWTFTLEDGSTITKVVRAG